MQMPIILISAGWHGRKRQHLISSNSNVSMLLTISPRGGITPLSYCTLQLLYKKKTFIPSQLSLFTSSLCPSCSSIVPLLRISSLPTYSIWHYLLSKNSWPIGRLSSYYLQLFDLLPSKHGSQQYVLQHNCHTWKLVQGWLPMWMDFKGQTSQKHTLKYCVCKAIVSCVVTATLNLPTKPTSHHLNSTSPHLFLLGLTFGLHTFAATFSKSFQPLSIHNTFSAFNFCPVKCWISLPSWVRGEQQTSMKVGVCVSSCRQ